MDGVGIEQFWQDYLATLPLDSPVRGQRYEAEAFGDSPLMADELGSLVMTGRKTATCWSLWEAEAEGEPLTEVGQKTILLDGQGAPLCIIETTEVEVRSFERVDERFAHDEGEGDRSLEHWREEHRRFFSRTLPEIGREFSPEMPLICERFRKVYSR